MKIYLSDKDETDQDSAAPRYNPRERGPEVGMLDGDNNQKGKCLCCEKESKYVYLKVQAADRWTTTELNESPACEHCGALIFSIAIKH